MRRVWALCIDGHVILDRGPCTCWLQTAARSTEASDRGRAEFGRLLPRTTAGAGAARARAQRGARLRAAGACGWGRARTAFLGRLDSNGQKASTSKKFQKVGV